MLAEDRLFFLTHSSSSSSSSLSAWSKLCGPKDRNLNGSVEQTGADDVLGACAEITVSAILKNY